MSAVDRLADGYEPRFDFDYAVGRRGELYVASILDGLKDGNVSVEVKTDEMAIRTGNVYIETECRYGGLYKPSGLATTEADVWVYVLGGDVVVAAPTSKFRIAADWARESGRLSACKVGSHPTKGVLVGLPRLLALLMSNGKVRAA